MKQEPSGVSLKETRGLGRGEKVKSKQSTLAVDLPALAHLSPTSTP